MVKKLGRIWYRVPAHFSWPTTLARTPPLPRPRHSYAAPDTPPRLNLLNSGDATARQTNPDLRQRHRDLEVTPWTTFDEPAHAGREKPWQWRLPPRTIGGHGLRSPPFSRSRPLPSGFQSSLVRAPDGVLGTSTDRPHLYCRAGSCRLGRAMQSHPSAAATPGARFGPRGHTTAEATRCLQAGYSMVLLSRVPESRGLFPTRSCVALSGFFQ